MIIDGNQLRIARRSIGLTQGGLAEESAVARNTIYLIESGSGFRAETMAMLQAILISHGVKFFADGSVAMQIDWASNSRPEDPQIRRAVIAVLSAQALANGKCALFDSEDGLS